MSAFILHNAHLLLTSGIGMPYDPQTGQGVIGKNYAYQIVSSVDVFFDDKIINPFIGAGALGMAIDEFNGDNFDHTGLGFIGGGYIALWNTNGRPIETHPVPEGTPKWGGKFKKAVAENYLKSATIATHGSVMSHRGNHLDLDPTYRDIHGRPLMRMTFDYTDNEHKMSDYLTDRATEIAKAMKRASSTPRSEKATIRSSPIRPRITPAARSWAAIRNRVPSTAICKAGTFTTSSSWARARFRKIRVTIRPERSAPSPTGPLTRSKTNT